MSDAEKGGITLVMGSERFVRERADVIGGLGLVAHAGFATTERVVEGHTTETVRAVAVVTEPGGQLPAYEQLAELTGATAVTFGNPALATKDMPITPPMLAA